MKGLEKDLRKILPIAVDTAERAGEIIRRKFGKFKSLEFKPDTSFVTEADQKAEALIMKSLKSKFRDHEFLGEETGRSGSSTPSLFRWHVDPLDGTTNFVHGFPMFCVSMGLELEGLGPVLGVIYQPITKEIYTAARGFGAFKGRRPLRVSQETDLGRALLSTGFSTRRERNFDPEIRAFSRVVEKSHAVRRTGSAALDLTFVATGQFDGFWERGLHSWDICAASCLVAEAGGLVTDFESNHRFLDSDTIVASNGKLHSAFLAALTA